MAISELGNNLYRNDETGQVVDGNHPIYQQWMQAGQAKPSTAPPGMAAPAPAAGAAPTAGGGDAPIAAQAQNASTYSQTPGAKPTGPTANAGTQDVARNSYLAMATQSRVPSANDPSIRVPADAFAAQQERARRNAVADSAEAQGPYATGAQRGVERMATERAGQASGSFEAELVQREMTARRAEILQALQGLSGFISEDQRLALQKELAGLSASLESRRLDQSGQQFSDQFGYNIARDEASMNNDIIRLLLGGA